MLNALCKEPLRRVLECLAKGGPQSLVELAVRETVHRSTCQRAIEDGLSRRLIQAVPSAGHRRGWLLRLCPSGKRLLTQIGRLNRTMTGQTELALRDVSDGDLEVCLNVLRVLSTKQASHRPSKAAPALRVRRLAKQAEVA